MAPWLLSLNTVIAWLLEKSSFFRLSGELSTEKERKHRSFQGFSHSLPSLSYSRLLLTCVTVVFCQVVTITNGNQETMRLSNQSTNGKEMDVGNHAWQENKFLSGRGQKKEGKNAPRARKRSLLPGMLQNKLDAIPTPGQSLPAPLLPPGGEQNDLPWAFSVARVAPILSLCQRENKTDQDCGCCNSPKTNTGQKTNYLGVRFN